MNIPINGRIAIIDDKYDHALPLMELFGKNQFPYLYYDGKVKNLPEKGESNNDIRILFLDIYLTGDSAMTEKQIKSSLIPVIDRVISDKNYPYLLIFWSRHDEEYRKLIEDIFNQDLRNKAPINMMSLRKGDYFELNSDKTKLHDEKIPELMTRIKEAIDKSPVYGYIMSWENLIHSSADSTLEEIFKSNPSIPEWNKNANYLFNKLGKSYSGKNYSDQSEIDKIKSSFYSLNYVFTDSLEYSISSNLKIENCQPLLTEKGDYNDTIFSVNKKLLFADEFNDQISPGIISNNTNKHNYGKLLHSSIIIQKIFDAQKETICAKLKGIVDDKILKKTRSDTEREVIREFKKEIIANWIPIEANITPICDYVQGKEEYSRLLPGLLIQQKFRNFFDTKSEALFISPTFKLSIANDFINCNDIYFLLFDFRFLCTCPKNELKKFMQPFLRIRQQLLTEIQSKLSRHINRQGILFLEE